LLAFRYLLDKDFACLELWLAPYQSTISYYMFIIRKGVDYRLMVAIGETQVHRASRSQKQEFHKPEFCHVCHGKLKEAESSSWTLADQRGSDEATPSKAVENRSWF
jgi:hypothetical protein